MSTRFRRRLPTALRIVAVACACTLVTGAIVAQQAVAASESEEEGRRGRTARLTNVTPEQMKTLVGDNLRVVYRFAGALNDASTKATVIQCSNTHPTDTTEIEVQLNEYNATSVYTGTVTVDPLQTATFESSQVPFYIADVFMNAGHVEQGYGRILAEHSDVVCTVQTIDPDNSPPTWSFDIPVHSLPIFTDGFESGDTSAWSLATP